MSDVKQKSYSRSAVGSYADNQSPGTNSAVAEAPAKRPAGARGKGEVTTWDAYRNWLTKVQAPEQRRSLPDPALFSFKGYRSWAEKVRRDWEYEE